MPAIRFRERSLTMIALVTLVTIPAVILATFRLADLSFIAGPEFSAEFAESGGLKTGDPVEVAGVIIGEVTDMRLGSNRVIVDFRAKDVELGNLTSARIKTGSLLGARFIELTPAGDKDLADTIPLKRTKAPYDLSSDLIEIAGRTSQIDMDAVSESLETFSDAIEPSIDELGPAMSAVTDLSKTIGERDEAVRSLFKRAEAVTGTFRERTTQITQLVEDGSLLLEELNLRREVIAKLLTDTRAVADEVTGLVKDNEKDLKPALAELEKVLDVLNKNEENIQLAVKRVSSFVTGLGEGVAAGPWFNGRIDLTTGVGPAKGQIPGLEGLLGQTPSKQDSEMKKEN